MLVEKRGTRGGADGSIDSSGKQMGSSVFGIALVALETSLVLEDISHSEVCRCLKYLLFLQHDGRLHPIPHH